ncbi:MAG: siroheme synthase, partial [Gammaproteobacteria bacterium]|nr:siroheme synthase [Gammaproteobacteria bacterium]
MEFLPVFLNIRDRKCVIVGGGEVAVRKARLLSRAEAKLHIIAPQLNTEMQSLCKAQAAVVTIGTFEPSQLAGAVLAIAATDDIKTNIAVSVAAKEFNIPVNVVDEPEYSTFITPAVVDRSPLVIAISSSGSSPILTRQVKALNETMLPSRMAELATLLREFREPVQESLTNFEDRVKFWEDVLDSEIPELVYSGQLEQGRDKLAARLTSKTAIDAIGEVYLVGAGPGDPDLLTLRALRLIHKADIVLYDRLVSDEIMLRIRPDAERIHVGKARSEHSVEQGKINQMLVDFARAGKRVLRLKGGD